MEVRCLQHRIRWIGWLLLVNAVVFAHSMTAMGDEKFTSQQLDFFENKIRPLLADRCLECHGADKSESDLRLDSREAILKGGASGEAAAITGNPEASLLIRSVEHAGDYDMPPDQQLSKVEIADLANWIAIGLPWPDSDASIAKLSLAERMQQHRNEHWSFQPVSQPPIPNVESDSDSPLDKLIVAKLKSKHLTLSPRADRRTLIRRATFDLIGLPPTYQEVESFIADESPDAYSNLIDRLLQSPQYGERWARHWLDVARYSDTSGYVLGEADNSFPFAFTYRDYVIDAFNNDLPYDQFIREQLAADYLDVPADKKTLAALGFITVGRQYLGRSDTIDDQVDVVTRGLMGLTVSCARCHDHKYDAIPTEDYYSLYSVFSNNFVPDELPLIGDEQQRARFESYFTKLEELKKEIESFRKSKHEELVLHIQQHFADYFAHVVVPDQESLIEQQSFVKLKGGDIRPKVLERWRTFFTRHHDEASIIAPSLELLAIPDEQFEQNADRLIGHWATHPNETKINSLYLDKLKADTPKQKLEIARILGELFSETLEQWKTTGSQVPPIGQFSGPQRDIAAILFHRISPAIISMKDLDGYLDLVGEQELAKLRDSVLKHNADAPEGLARAMVIRDSEELNDQRVMIRGNAGNLGAVAPRRFVKVLSDEKSDGLDGRPDFENKSGRLELAEKIASRENPLTARVLVNRVWMHHFSQPLVDTPSDFGIRCAPPLHLDLLDHLADGFMKNGWSIKQLHRIIMLSDTYCQSSIERPECANVDPENRLLWKMNRRRLEFEPLRDSVLAVAGQLDPKLHGKPIELFERPVSNRRTIYGLINRQDLPGLYRVFDLANPDQSAEKRIRTTVPQQSLFMLNSFFVTLQARNLADAIPDFEHSSPQDKLTWLYRTLYQRDPDARELEIGIHFIETATPKTDDENLGPWERYAQLLLCANEFEFID